MKRCVHCHNRCFSLCDECHEPLCRWCRGNHLATIIFYRRCCRPCRERLWDEESRIFAPLYPNLSTHSLSGWDITPVTIRRLFAKHCGTCGVFCWWSHRCEECGLPICETCVRGGDFRDRRANKLDLCVVCEAEYHIDEMNQLPQLPKG